MFFRGAVAVLLSTTLVAQTAPAPKPPAKAPAAPKRAATAATAIEDRMKANSEAIDKLSKLLSDSDFAQDELREIIVNKLVALRCDNKVLLLESVLGANNVSDADRKSVRDKCSARERRELAGTAPQNVPQPVAAAANASGLPEYCALPPKMPVMGKPETRHLKTPNDTPSSPAYDAWVVRTTKDSGTQVVGEHTIQVRYFNILRYSYAMGATVTFTDGPAIPSALALGVTAFPAMSVPASAGPGPSLKITEGAPNPAEEFQKKWVKYQRCYEEIQDRVVAIDLAINNAADATQKTASNINSVLNAHAAKIVDDYKALRDSADDAAVFGKYYDFSWPTMETGTLLSAASRYRDEGLRLKTDPGYATWTAIGGNKDVFDLVKSQTDRVIDHLTSLGPTGDAAGKLRQAQDSVRVWRSHFNTVSETGVDGFTPSYDVACDAWFGRGKTALVKLSVRDRLNPSGGEETTDLISVVCNPPLTISTGIGASLVREKVPGFVPGIKRDAAGNPVLDANNNPVTVDKLGYTSESRAKPIYALQINGAIREFPSGFGLHGSIGMAIGGANDTTNTEFLAGLSGSFLRRTFFVTPALHLARRLDFLSEFKAGDLRGNLSSPPTKMQWKPGFAVTITFPVTR